MREKKSIPILGIDERFNERQQIPGIAKQLLGVRPNGLEEYPHWVPIPNPDDLKNTAHTPFTHANGLHIVKLFWHIRSRVGKHGTDGSLKRLVVVFNTGVIELIDPDKDTGWVTVASYTISSSDSGAWGASFTQMYDTGYLAITKGGVPQGDYFVEDDLIVPFIFPELPIIQTFAIPSDKKYSKEILDAEEHEGIKEGSIYLRYAFRLASGQQIKHSCPEILGFNLRPDKYVIDVHTTIDHWFTNFIVTTIEGYGIDNIKGDRIIQEPQNFDFWKGKIKGIDVLVSEIYYSESSIDESQFLRDSVWRVLHSFNNIDKNELSDVDKYSIIRVNESGINTLETADIDDGTNHLKSHSVVDIYNSRFILGEEKIDFAKPQLIQKAGINNFRAYIKKGGIWYVDSVDTNTGDYSDGIADLTNNEEYPNCIIVPAFYGQLKASEFSADGKIYQLSGGGFIVTGTPHYNQSIQIRCEISDQYHINFSGTEMLDNKGKFIPFSHYNDANFASSVTYPKKWNIKLSVEIETESGNFTRLYDGEETIYDWGTALDIGTIIYYPDNRATKIKIFVDETGNGDYDKVKEVNLIASTKANFAFAILRDGERITDSLIDPVNTIEEPDDIGNNNCLLSTNKVRVSEVNSLLSYSSKLVYHIGNGYSRVTGFAVNALEVSQGQFGQYPLFVFKEDSIWALEQSSSAEVVFSSISPIDASIGVDNEENIETISNVIFFANSKGIYQLAGSVPKRISEPVKSIHSNIQTLGSIRTDDDRELLVAVGSTIYRYSLKYRRWYQSEGNIHYFFKNVEHLYGLNDLGKIIDFETDSGTVVPMIIELEDIHFGHPDYLKRFFYFYLRGNVETASNYLYRATLGGKNFDTTNKKYLYPKFKSIAKASLFIHADNEVGKHHIEGIDTEYSIRYKRKRGSI